MLNSDDALDTQASVRRANLRRALQLVFRGSGAQTRAGIARATGLTAATASSLVAELIESRLVVEGAQAASTGGKRATTLSVDAAHHVILVIVMRPTDARLALVALDGSEIDVRAIVYAADSRRARIDEAVTRIAADYGDRLLVAAVQLPGTTDGRRVLESVQLGWSDVPLADGLEEILRVPVLLVNDVDAEAIAESAGEDESSGYRLFIHIGVGIGAAVTLDGQLAPGPRDRAGEIGHVQVEFGEEARLCRCGRRGCLESASSMTAMLGDDVTDAMDDAAVAALAATVDAGVFEEGARALARTVKLASALLDPAEVVIGGPVSSLGDSFLDLVRVETDYLATGTAAVPVRFARGGSNPSIGAGQFALFAALGVLWSAEQLSAGATSPRWRAGHAP